jgi:hypothetical protein
MRVSSLENRVEHMHARLWPDIYEEVPPTLPDIYEEETDPGDPPDAA